MSAAYHILPGLFLRTPLFSYADYPAGQLSGVLQDPQFRLALYLASPGFYRLAEAKGFDPGRLDAKELLSLWKYYNRMSFRPTPFGLFSSFSVTRWGSGKNILLAARPEARVHLLADQQLAHLAERLLTGDQAAGDYELNPTSYRCGRELRYIKTTTEPGQTRLAFSLESLPANPLTRALGQYLKRGARSVGDILGFLLSRTGCTESEATDYLEFLVRAQVLVSVRRMNITGRDYLQLLVAEHADAPPALAELALGFMTGLPPSLGSLQYLESRLKALLADQGLEKPGQFFYVNTERAPLQGSLPESLQPRLLSAIGALARLALPPRYDLLEKFKSDFSGRFEGRKIPLLLALDPDAGVGYGNFAAPAGTPVLLKDLSFPATREETPGVAWSAVHRLLLEKWSRLEKGNGVISLEEHDLRGLDEPTAELPPSLSVMFRLSAEGLLIESAGGATAASLIGRFTPFSEDALAIARAVAAAEREANPGILFAEIGQLSDSYADNVNRRLAVYDYEIPVNSSSLLPRNQQLRLDDLLVSLAGGEVILESRRLGKRVIPRLSSAFNFSHNSLAVFRFLCDLQYQSLRAGLTFDPANYFPGMSHYPRMTYTGTILSPARWHLKAADLAELPPGEWRALHGIPSRVALTRFDQQLVFDLDDPRQARRFLDTIAAMADFTLQESFLPSEAEPRVCSADGKPLIGQFIAFLIKNGPVYQAPLFVPPRDARVIRDFVLGSEWLYLKIYCPATAANDLLAGRILPVVSKILREGPACWFFIRFNDPGPHIRLRIRIREGRAGEVIALLKAQFSALVQNRFIREYQADTYRRELERYGGALISLVEDFFMASSELVLRAIKNSRAQDYDPDRLAISSMALMIDTALPGPARQLPFLATVSAGFFAEFKGDKALRVELDKRYRQLQPGFSAAAGELSLYRELRLQRCRRRFTGALRAVMKNTGDWSESRRIALLADLVHMHLNRVYPDRQRQQEMVLYHCFYKYRLSGAARAGSSTTGVPAALDQQVLH